MSFLKSLFGGGKSGGDTSTGPAKPTEVVQHRGFSIAATPFEEAGQYQVCGVISKVVNGVAKEHRFIRADRCAGIEAATTATLVKGRQIVDLQGDQVFD